MEERLDDLAHDVAALTQRFLDLGAKLGEAAKALEQAGAPPSDGLIEALGSARTHFIQLRTDILAAADAAEVPPGAQPESLNDLEPILQAVAEALRDRARRAALEEAKRRALTTLDCVLELVHRDDPAFRALVECHARARELHATIEALSDPAADTRQTFDAVVPFAELRTMVEDRDGLDDERYARLEEVVTRTFGRSLAVAVARGRLGFAGDIVEAPAEPSPPEPLVEPAAARSEPQTASFPAPAPESSERVSATPPSETPRPAPEISTSQAALPEPMPEPDVAQDSMPVLAAAAEPESAPAEPSGPDETAQWWLAAWSRWSRWKSSLAFPDAVREEIGKYPYLLSVPIQKSPEYEDGLLAYGYSILMDHVERQNAGCVGNALTSLDPGQTRPVGEQLYDYLVAQGRLRDTYAEFVRSVTIAAVPDPGLWFQFRILESKEDTRILQRPSARIGEAELSGQRLGSEGQRYAEHKFRMTLGPLTTRFVLVSADVRETRGVAVKILANGAPADSGWIVAVPGGRSAGKTDARRVVEEGTHLPGLGKDYAAMWVAVFNDDPFADRRVELSVFLRKDAKSPFTRRT